MARTFAHICYPAQITILKFSEAWEFNKVQLIFICIVIDDFQSH